jgi:hypothetical protein
MTKLMLFVVLVLASSTFGEQPTPKECKAGPAKWVPMFKAAYDDPACKGDGSEACPFVLPVREFTTTQLTDLVSQADGCAKVDTHNRYLYQRVATRAENIIVMRTGYFLRESGQEEKFAEREGKKAGK